MTSVSQQLRSFWIVKTLQANLIFLLGTKQCGVLKEFFNSLEDGWHSAVEADIQAPVDTDVLQNLLTQEDNIG